MVRVGQLPRQTIGCLAVEENISVCFASLEAAKSVETIAEGTMAPKIAVKSRFALVDAGFNPELMYYTMDFDFTGCSLV